MNEWDLFIRFGAALVIGFSIGLQREFSHGGSGKNIPAGERTFALLALAGALAAAASDQFAQPLIFFGMLISIGLLVVIGYYFKANKQHVGMTTEVAILVTVLLGGLCYWGYIGLAVAVGVATTLILSLKLETDRFVQALTRADIQAALQFAVISAVVLPVLPNQALLPPPFDVLNPFKIWLMVVFISGISFLAYVLIKVIGSERGIGISGLLGGLVSSTAVTMSLSQRSKKESRLAKAFAFAILLAWAVMFLRVMVQIAVVNLQLLTIIWLPLSLAGLVGFAYALYVYVARRNLGAGRVEFSNPFDLRAAVRFGLLYAFILLISRSAQLYLGEAGVLVSSFFAGFSDSNAITLSLSELSHSGGLSLGTAAQGIVIATMTNTLFKGGIVLSSASPALRKAIWPGLVLVVVVGVGAAYLL
jgi:uncharacterized membrane protein (DUF4010 family)